jgi:hypothetical protein
MTLFKLVTTNIGKHGSRRLTYPELIHKFQAECALLNSLGFKFKDRKSPQGQDEEGEIDPDAKYQIKCKILSIPVDNKEQYRITCSQNNRMVLMKRINDTETPIILFRIDGFNLKIIEIYSQY